MFCAAGPAASRSPPAQPTACDRRVATETAVMAGWSRPPRRRARSHQRSPARGCGQAAGRFGRMVAHRGQAGCSQTPGHRLTRAFGQRRAPQALRLIIGAVAVCARSRALLLAAVSRWTAASTMPKAMLQPGGARRVSRTVTPAPRATHIVPVKMRGRRPDMPSDGRSRGSRAPPPPCALPIPPPRGPARPGSADLTAKASTEPPCQPPPRPLNTAPTERWPSGRRRTPGKCVGGEPSRGFESLSLRQFSYLSI
jgi:hypothetical protein